MHLLLYRVYQSHFYPKNMHLRQIYVGADPFTKPPLFQRNRLTCSGNPTFESCVEVKAQQR